MNIEIIESHENFRSEDGHITQATVTKPLFKDGSGSGRLTRYYDKVERTILERLKASAKDAPSSVGMKYRITFNKGDIVSLCLDITVQDSTFRIADTWKSGYPLSIEKLGLKKRTAIDNCLEKARLLAESGYIALPADYRDRIQKHFDKRNFYIDEDRTVIFFNPGLAASKGYGVLEFRL